jgi:hypothetical protein
MLKAINNDDGIKSKQIYNCPSCNTLGCNFCAYSGEVSEYKYFAYRAITSWVAQGRPTFWTQPKGKAIKL